MGVTRPLSSVTLVTGGAGFIGANLCRALVDEGIGPVRVLDDLSTGTKSNLVGLDVDFYEGSVLDGALVREAAMGAASIVHLAALPSVPRSIVDPVACHEANATGTLSVLEAARATGVGHVIVASSSSVYGANPTVPKSETLATLPRSPYAASKLAAESYSLAYGACFGLEVLAFRFFNVFGPLQPADHAYAAVTPIFISAALQGRPLPVHSDGRQTRDFTFVASVTSVIADAIRRRVSHPAPVNLAYGSRRSLLDLIAALEKIVGRPLEVVHHPPRPGDVRDSQADQALLRSLFPALEPVAFDVGLRRTVEWFVEASQVRLP